MAKKSETKTKAEPWQRHVCDALLTIVAKRKQAKADITDLIKYRKQLDGEIDELGPKPTKERLELDHALVTTLRGINFQRDRERWLADQLEAVIDDADQGKLWDGEQIKTDITQAQLFKEQEAKRKADEEAKKKSIVPCIGGTYRFVDDSRDVTGCVKGGGPKFCRVEIDSVQKGDAERGEIIEIEWQTFTLTEIDVPSDAIAVDQQGTPSAASEMAGAR